MTDRNFIELELLELEKRLKVAEYAEFRHVTGNWIRVYADGAGNFKIVAPDQDTAFYVSLKDVVAACRPIVASGYTLPDYPESKAIHVYKRRSGGKHLGTLAPHLSIGRSGGDSHTATVTLRFENEEDDERPIIVSLNHYDLAKLAKFYQAKKEGFFID